MMTESQRYHRKKSSRASAALALSLLLMSASMPEAEGFTSRQSRHLGLQQTRRIPPNPLLMPYVVSSEHGAIKNASFQTFPRYYQSKHRWEKRSGYLYSAQVQGIKKFASTKKMRFLLLLSAAIGLTMTLFPLRAVASTVVLDPSVTTLTSGAGEMLASSAGAAPSVAGAAVGPTAMVASQAPLMVSPPVAADVEVRLCFRLLYAALLGAGLGKERSFAKHSAGVRTMALVAMGASAYTVCSTFGFLAFGGKYDPSRMASNVASGVGFIGAGVITTTMSNRSQNVVHGLTTAAAIWISAAIGVASGVGLLRLAGTTTLATISILRLGRVKPKNRNTEGSKSSSKSTSSRVTVSDPETHDTTDWDEHNDNQIESPIPKIEIRRQTSNFQERIRDTLGDVDVPALVTDDDTDIYPEPIIIGQNKAMDKVLESMLQKPEQLKRHRLREERKSHNVTSTSDTHRP